MKLIVALCVAAASAQPAVTCQFTVNGVNEAGNPTAWSVTGGNHNLPADDKATRSYTVAGEGCLVLAYTEPNQRGRMETLVEGVHARTQVHPFQSVTVLNPRPVLCASGMYVDPTDNTQCLQCPANTWSNKGDNHCSPMQKCSHTKCFHVRAGDRFKFCPDGTYTDLTQGLEGSYSYSSTDSTCRIRLSQGFMHVFHNGIETNGKHHRCKVDESTKNGGAPSCTCHCYDGKPGLGEYSHAQAQACADIFAETSAAAVTTDPTTCFATIRSALDGAGCGQWFQSNSDLHNTCDEATSVGL